MVDTGAGLVVAEQVSARLAAVATGFWRQAMAKCLQRLLFQAFDYEGELVLAEYDLLGLEPIGMYRRVVSEPEFWMLDRFVCPVARLSELGARRSIFDPSRPDRLGSVRPLRLSVVLPAPESSETLGTPLEEGMQSLRDFLSEHGEWVSLRAIEIRQTTPLVPQGVRPTLDRIEEKLVQHGVSAPRTILEVFLADDDGNGAAHVACACVMPSTATQRRIPLIRVPATSTEAHDNQLAQFIVECRAHGVGLKFSGASGAAISGAEEYGIVNLLVASVFGLREDCGLETIEGILRERKFHRFSFTDECLIWDDISLTYEELHRAKAESELVIGVLRFHKFINTLRELRVSRAGEVGPQRLRKDESGRKRVLAWYKAASQGEGGQVEY